VLFKKKKKETDSEGWGGKGGYILMSGAPSVQTEQTSWLSSGVSPRVPVSLAD